MLPKEKRKKSSLEIFKLNWIRAYELDLNETKLINNKAPALNRQQYYWILIFCKLAYLTSTPTLGRFKSLKPSMGKQRKISLIVVNCDLPMTEWQDMAKIFNFFQKFKVFSHIYGEMLANLLGMLLSKFWLL